MSTPGGFPVAEPATADAAVADPGPTLRLRRLLHKYELLLELGRGVPGRTLERRDAMRVIAQHFPAALREWDELPPLEIERRHAVLTELLVSGTAPDPTDATESWLRYALDVHDCLRAVLQLRRYLRQQVGGHRLRPADPESTAQHLASCQALVHGCEIPWLTVTPALLDAIVQPAAGRLTALAYQAVADHHGTSAAVIKHALFSRPAPR